MMAPKPGVPGAPGAMTSGGPAPGAPGMMAPKPSGVTTETPAMKKKLKVLWDKGRTAKSKGDYAGARRYWQDALKISPQHPGFKDSIDKLPGGPKATPTPVPEVSNTGISDVGDATTNRLSAPRRRSMTTTTTTTSVPGSMAPSAGMGAPSAQSGMPPGAMAPAPGAPAGMPPGMVAPGTAPRVP